LGRDLWILWKVLDYCRMLDSLVLSACGLRDYLSLLLTYVYRYEQVREGKIKGLIVSYEPTGTGKIKREKDKCSR
jgi:hypothetical protein